MAICKECGANVPNNVKFCTECGAVINNEEKTEQSSVVPVPQQNQYAQPQQQYNQQYNQQVQNVDTNMTIGQWIKTFALQCIPIANFIFMISWLFGCSKYKTRVNYARGAFLFGLIIWAISFVFMIILLLFFREYFDSFSGFDFDYYFDI